MNGKAAGGHTAVTSKPKRDESILHKALEEEIKALGNKLNESDIATVNSTQNLLKVTVLRKFCPRIDEGRCDTPT